MYAIRSYYVSLYEERTWIRTPYFMPNSTERIWRTLAPRLESSSISSKEIFSSFRASPQMFGAVVKIVITSYSIHYTKLYDSRRNSSRRFST